MSSSKRTLASDGPSGNSAHPNLPLPSSAMKKGPLRSSVVLPRASMAAHPYSTTARPSMSSTDNPNSKRRSMLPPSRMGDVHASSNGSRGDGGMFGRTPQGSRSLAPTRRSSVFGPAAGRASTVTPAYGAQHGVKDPRPVRAQAFMSECKENISRYLQHRKAQVVLGPNWQTSPTGRDFHALFQFLAEELTGPGIPWGKKFENDCISIMRDLQYPVLDTISKTSFSAPGSQQSWPSFLAMLDWMVELCKAQERWQDRQTVNDPLLSQASDLSPDHPNLEERLLWDFVSTTYTDWFEGRAEEFDPYHRQLEDAFERISSASAEECERLEKEVSDKEAVLHRLRREEPPIKLIDEEYNQLMSDKVKFDNFIELHRQKVKKLVFNNDKAREAVSAIDQRIAAAREQLTSVESEVSAQNLSPEEVTRMTHDKETLARNLDDIALKIADTLKQSKDQEMRVTQGMDRCEQSLEDYDVLGAEIGTLSVITDPKPSTFEQIDYSFTVDLGAENLNVILQLGRSRLSDIRPALDNYARGSRDQVDKLRDEETTLEERRMDLAENVDNHREEVVRRQLRFSSVQQQAEYQRDLLRDDISKNSLAVGNLEAEVQGKGQAESLVVQAKSRLERVKMVYDSLLLKTQQLQGRAVNDLVNNIDMMISAKSQAAASLESIMLFAERQE